MGNLVVMSLSVQSELCGVVLKPEHGKVHQQAPRSRASCQRCQVKIREL